MKKSDEAENGGRKREKRGTLTLTHTQNPDTQTEQKTKETRNSGKRKIMPGFYTTLGLIDGHVAKHVIGTILLSDVMLMWRCGVWSLFSSLQK